MNNGDSELARLQADLLDHLAQERSLDAINGLREIETSLVYQSWMESFDPHMTQLASHLIQKWGRRSDL